MRWDILVEFMEQLVRHYFSQSDRQVTLSADEVVLRQSGQNDRLYLVLRGELEGYFESDEDGKLTKTFHGVGWCIYWGP